MEGAFFFGDEWGDLVRVGLVWFGLWKIGFWFGLVCRKEGRKEGGEWCKSRYKVRYVTMSKEERVSYPPLGFFYIILTGFLMVVCGTLKGMDQRVHKEQTQTSVNYIRFGFFQVLNPLPCISVFGGRFKMWRTRYARQS